MSFVSKMIHHKTVPAFSGGLILFWVRLVVDLLGSAVEKEINEKRGVPVVMR